MHEPHKTTLLRLIIPPKNKAARIYIATHHAADTWRHLRHKGNSKPHLRSPRGVSQAASHLGAGKCGVRLCVLIRHRHLGAKVGEEEEEANDEEDKDEDTVVVCGVCGDASD